MTNVRRQQDFVLLFAAMEKLAVRQVAVFERGVDDDVVVSIGKLEHLVVGDAEAPRCRVVRRVIWDEIGLLGQRV